LKYNRFLTGFTGWDLSFEFFDLNMDSVFLVIRWKDIKSSNLVVECITLLLRVLEIPGSNLGRKTGYPEVFGDFI
jgi:hypothetical protein